MTNDTTTRILQQHNIGFRIENNRIIADDICCVDGVAKVSDIDVTDMSLKELAIWLGY